MSTSHIDNAQDHTRQPCSGTVTARSEYTLFFFYFHFFETLCVIMFVNYRTNYRTGTAVYTTYGLTSLSLSVLRGLISGTREPIRRIRFRFNIDSFVSFHPTEYTIETSTPSLSRLRSQTTHDDNGDVCQDMFVSTRSSQLRVLTSHLTRVTTRLREAEAPAGHRGVRCAPVRPLPASPT
jgi:hypothetical protein